MNKFIIALIIACGTFTIAANALADETITVAETVIIVKKPAAQKPVKVWRCAAPRALVQGPVNVTVKNCEWTSK